MPETSGGYHIKDGVPQIVRDFEEFLNKRTTMTVLDMDNIELVIYIRLRALLTKEQMHERAHHILHTAEEVLHMPGAVKNLETGEEVPPTLVENFDSPFDVIEMTQQATQGLSEEEIEAFMNQFGTKEEEE